MARKGFHMQENIPLCRKHKASFNELCKARNYVFNLLGRWEQNCKGPKWIIKPLGSVTKSKWSLKHSVVARFSSMTELWKKNHHENTLNALNLKISTESGVVCFFPKSSTSCFALIKSLKSRLKEIFLHTKNQLSRLIILLFTLP